MPSEGAQHPGVRGWDLDAHDARQSAERARQTPGVGGVGRVVDEVALCEFKELS